MTLSVNFAYQDSAAQQPTSRTSSVPFGSTWPHQLSHEALLRVSDVLRLVGGEFPALTPSKLRFFDRQGLVSPQRTASGYRQYSASDVERLRFVLREQRDFYRPLAVIQETLGKLDSGELRQAITPREAQEDATAFVSGSQLAALAGVEPGFVAQLASEKLISETVPGGFERNLAPLVTACAQYIALGADLRSIRVLRNAATREVDQAKTAWAPERVKGEAGTADARAGELAHAAVRLFGAWVDSEISS